MDSPLRACHHRGIAVRLTFLCVLCAALLGAAAASGDVNPQGFYVVFHADHTITVTLGDGTPLGSTTGPGNTIAPGNWDIFMDDSASVSGPQFDLQGPGVNFVDSMFLGEDPSETFAVTLQPSSTYTWRDDEHPNVVFTFQTAASGGTTTTGSSGQSAGSPTKGSSTGSSPVGTKVTVNRGTLTAAVSAAGKPTLALKGKAVKTLKSGKYTVAVDDASKHGGFLLQELRHTAIPLTTAAFTGKRSKTVTLAAGQWTFYSSTAHKSFFVVTT